MKTLTLNEMSLLAGGNHDINAPFCQGLATAILAGGSGVISSPALTMYLEHCSPVVI